jgi:hypothetical protein
MAIAGFRARAGLHGLAAVMAVLVLGFCLSSAVPAMGADLGCQGAEAGGRICAQPGTASLILFVVPEMSHLQPDRGTAAWLGAPAEPVSGLEFHADRSTPRAPPFALA